MAPKIRITREMILQAAFEIIRKNGYESLNARSVAECLNCSTQPILYHFKTMAEIRDAVYEEADKFHTLTIMNGMEGADDPFLGIGLAYIRFGRDEKNLFRFLFQTNHYDGVSLADLINSPDLAPLLDLARSELECDPEEVKEKFLIFVSAVHGYASLLANNALEYDEDQAVRTLEMIFDAMKGRRDEKTL